jgi:hypothetical protein
MENKFYKTKDLAEAGALITKKQHLIKMDREGAICWFIFSDRQICEDLANRFFFGELLVNAKDYHQTLSVLKNRIFSK